MEAFIQIIPPTGEDDREGAQRVFEEFLTLYQPTLVRTEYYLEQIMEELEPEYAEAYRPWHQALHNLFRGVYLISKKIPLSDPEGFMESLRMFSFDSAIRFLYDLCISCRLALQRDWIENFHKHINMLLFSATILNRQQQVLSH